MLTAFPAEWSWRTQELRVEVRHPQQQTPFAWVSLLGSFHLLREKHIFAAVIDSLKTQQGKCNIFSNKWMWISKLFGLYSDVLLFPGGLCRSRGCEMHMGLRVAGVHSTQSPDTDHLVIYLRVHGLLYAEVGK